MGNQIHILKGNSIMTLVTIKEVPKKERKKMRNDVSSLVEDFYKSTDRVCLVACSAGEYKNFMSAYNSVRQACRPYKDLISVHAIDNDIYLEKLV